MLEFEVQQSVMQSRGSSISKWGMGENFCVYCSVPMHVRVFLIKILEERCSDNM
jgi:hypothetical protein